MKKSVLCFMTTILFLFPFLPASALNPCEHYPGQVADHELEEVNKVPPQEGVAGSVDLRCPICHQIVDSTILPALPMPAEHPASSNKENSQPVKKLPESASIVSSESQDSRSETPVSPAASSPAETTVKSEKQEKTENPEKPENPAQSAGTGAVTPADGGNTVRASEDEPRKAQDVTANEAPETGGSAEGGGTAGSAARTGAMRNAGRANTGGAEGTDTPGNRPPQTFPYRRIKMKPRPGIRAEAPGELIWPLYGTPFQSLYND